MRKRITLPEVAESTAPAEEPLEIDALSKLPELAPSNKIDGLMIRRKQVAGRLIATGAGRERVIEALVSHDPSLSQYQARRVYYAVLEDWNRDAKAEAPYQRALAIQRFQNDLATMRSERVAKNLPPERKRATWSDIARAERELSYITGIRAPINVRVLDVNETMRESLAAVIGDMTPDEMSEIIGEGMEVADDEPMEEELP